jgi:hypothetical protein
MKVYVAGPMRNIPDFNFPAFDEAASYLRALGHEVCNPADRDREQHGDEVNASPTGDLADIAHTGFDLREALGWDVAWIAKHADAIYMLEGWEKSKGARAEHALAVALGLEVICESNLGDEVSFIDSPAFLDILKADLGLKTTEVRTVSATGGEKGVKPARLGAVDPAALLRVAEVAGFGAEKYARYNFARGYEWSKSFDALQRHMLAFWNGEDIDAEFGTPHLAHAAWHCLTLLTFLERGIGTDDRLATLIAAGEL